MWVRVGIVAGRILLRLLIRLAPFLMVGAAALVRRYRWPLYYRFKGLAPARASFAAVPAMVLGSIGGVVLLGVGLYFLLMHLAPHP